MLALANTIGFVHVVLEIWLATGMLLALLMPRLWWSYWATLVATIASRIAWGGCPLTIWQEALKHHPDVEPILGTAFTIEVPRTWLGLDLSQAGATSLMMLALVISSACLLWRRRLSVVQE